VPRYTFRLEPSGIEITDELEFSDDAAAQEEAGLIARDLARNVRPSRRQRIAVIDEAGKLVFEQLIVDPLP